MGPGRIYGLVGPNGAGKTTLLKILAGLVLPTEGRILLDGTDLTADPSRTRELVGFVVTDERSLFWRLTARENLRFFAALQGLGGAERDARIASCLDRVGLREMEGRTVRSLSTGLRQRLAVARGLLVDPPVLLLDEPTRSLDPGAARQVRGLLRELIGSHRARILVYASHNLAEIEDLCTDVLLIRGGKIVAERNLRDRGGAADLTYLLRTGDRVPPEVLEDLPSVERRPDDGNEMTIRLPRLEALDLLLDRLRARGIRVLELRPVRPSLESLFDGDEGP